MNDYEKAFQLKAPKYRSSILTNGLNKSGERALLYATGMVGVPFLVVAPLTMVVYIAVSWLLRDKVRSGEIG